MKTLLVHTARISYRGPDRLDITRKSAGAEGIAFAPSSRILWPMIALRRRAPEAVDAAWPGYVDAYTAEMRRSYREQRPAWDALLARAEVTLVCYCQDQTRCHRTVLAGILTRLGARYAGERGATPPAPTSPARTARDERKRADIDWLGAAILTRVERHQRPHFRAFVIAGNGAIEIWPRPTTPNMETSR